MYDLAINNGVVVGPVDGEYVSNIGVSTGKIEKISHDFLKGKVSIDLQGEKVAPGFIDIHMHGGEVNAPCIFYAEIFDYMALMGVTTCVGGNCCLGNSEILKFKNLGLPVNYLSLIGHGALRMIDAAYREGVDLGVDAYPYAAFSTFIGSAVFDPGCFEKWGVSYEAVLVCEGRYRGQRCSEEIFNYIRKHEPDNLVVAFVMKEEEVVRAIRHPLVMVASDGIIKDGQGHPRAAGAFPRVLGRYVREEKHLNLIEAVNKITLMPAGRLNLATKGRIKEGYDADITIFNSDTIIDRATFENPTEPPDGIEYVFVNGIKVVEKGSLTGNLPGALLSVQ